MIYPMFAMVCLSFFVMALIGISRIRSVQTKQVHPRYYKLMSGGEVPEFIAQTTRHFSNLFEVPVLFYIAGLLYILLGMAEPLMIYCAWIFVGARFVHALIHLTYNNPLHRLLVFLVSSLAVLSMWGLIVASQG